VSRDTRTARLTAYVTLIAVLALGLGGLLIAPAVYSARNNSDEVRRSNELAACRSELRADIDDATTSLEVANSQLLGLLPEGIAAAMNDPTLLDELLGQAQAATAAQDDAVNELLAANARYRDAAELSADNPDEFLRQCAQP
jgi:hypothetical protein